MRKLVLGLVLFCILSLNAFAETFFWEDKSGVHMVNDPSKLPLKFKNKYNKMVSPNLSIIQSPTLTPGPVK
jgi:hypothetical protein